MLRFIEYMDVGASNGWNMSEVLPSAEVMRLIDAHFPLEPLDAHSAAETAQRWGYSDGSDETVATAVARIWEARGDRYSQLRGSATPRALEDEPRVEMSYIGG